MNKWLIAFIIIFVLLVIVALSVGIAFAVAKTEEKPSEHTEPPYTPYIPYSPEPIFGLEGQPINISFSELVGPNKNFKPVLSNII